jgi:hypothetical protein
MPLEELLLQHTVAYATANVRLREDSKTSRCQKRWSHRQMWGPKGVLDLVKTMVPHSDKLWQQNREDEAAAVAATSAAAAEAIEAGLVEVAAPETTDSFGHLSASRSKLQVRDDAAAGAYDDAYDAYDYDDDRTNNIWFTQWPRGLKVTVTFTLKLTVTLTLKLTVTLTLKLTVTLTLKLTLMLTL